MLFSCYFLLLQDPSTCACIQLTNQTCKAMDGKDNDKTTYQYKRLKDCIQTGYIIFLLGVIKDCIYKCLQSVFRRLKELYWRVSLQFKRQSWVASQFEGEGNWGEHFVLSPIPSPSNSAATQAIQKVACLIHFQSSEIF